MTKRDEFIGQAKLIKHLLSFYQAERERLANILQLAGVETAQIEFKIPEKPSRDLIDALALAMKISYEANGRTHTIPTCKVTTVTASGEPVLMFPNGCPNVQHLAPLFEISQNDIEDNIYCFSGRYVMDVYTELCTKIITSDLNEEQAKAQENSDDTRSE